MTKRPRVLPVTWWRGVLSIALALGAIWALTGCLIVRTTSGRIALRHGGRDVGHLERLAPTVWRHVTTADLSRADVPRRWPRSANGLLIEGDGGSVLVDVGWDAAQANSLLDFAETRGKPVKLAVVTHAHADRPGGLAAVQARGVPSVGRRVTLEGSVSREPVSPTRGLRGAREPVRSPTEVEILDPGRGHAWDGLVVWVPKAGVLFAGGLVRDAPAPGLGSMASADTASRAQSVAAVRAAFPPPSIVVPGHGEPVVGTEWSAWAEELTAR